VQKVNSLRLDTVFHAYNPTYLGDRRIVVQGQLRQKVKPYLKSARMHVCVPTCANACAGEGGGGTHL
jgi:hypothetical protein